MCMLYSFILKKFYMSQWHSCNAKYIETWIGYSCASYCLLHYVSSCTSCDEVSVHLSCSFFSLVLLIKQCMIPQPKLYLWNVRLREDEMTVPQTVCTWPKNKNHAVEIKVLWFGWSDVCLFFFLWQIHYIKSCSGWWWTWRLSVWINCSFCCLFWHWQAY